VACWRIVEHVTLEDQMAMHGQGLCGGILWLDGCCNPDLWLFGCVLPDESLGAGQCFLKVGRPFWVLEGEIGMERAGAGDFLPFHCFLLGEWSCSGGGGCVVCADAAKTPQLGMVLNDVDRQVHSFEATTLGDNFLVLQLVPKRTGSIGWVMDEIGLFADPAQRNFSVPVSALLQIIDVASCHFGASCWRDVCIRLLICALDRFFQELRARFCLCWQSRETFCNVHARWSLVTE